MKKFRLVAMLLLACTVSLAGFSKTLAASKDCAHAWTVSFTNEFPRGYWSPGSHNYEIDVVTSPDGPYYWYWDFDVTEQADPIKGQVYLRLGGLSGHITEINHSQDTAMQITWILFESREESQEYRSSTRVRFRWDGGSWVEIPAGPLTKFCAWDNPGHSQRSWAK